MGKWYEPKTYTKPFESAVKTGVGIGLDAVSGGAYSQYKSYKTQKKANKAQKEQLARSKAILEKQKAEALEQRKNQINQQREQIGAGGYSTRHTSEKGITGKIKRDELG